MKPTEFVVALAKHKNFDDAQTNYLYKVASDYEKVAVVKGVTEYMKSVGPHLLGILGASTAFGLLGYALASKRYSDMQSQLHNSHNELLLTKPELGADPHLFSQRFHELSLVSPTVASNPHLAGKIIEPRLEKGFDLDDIHRLAAVEHHTNASGRIPHPLSALTSESVEGLKRMIDFMAPTAVQFGQVRSQAQSDFETRKKQELAEIAALRKKASANQFVSDECLGVMLADRYCLYKKAGIFQKTAAAGAVTKVMGKVKDLFMRSSDPMLNHLKLVAVPLALGMGIQAVRQLMKQRETSQLRNQAEEVFGQLRRKSDVIRENPELASEAFDSLRSFAPSLAAKPLIAKSFIEHVVSTQRLGPETAQQLAQTEEKVQQVAELAGGGSFMAGLQAPLNLLKFSLPGDNEVAQVLAGHKAPSKNLAAKFEKALSFRSSKKED